MGKIFGLTLPKWAMPQANPARVALMAAEAEGTRVLPQADFYRLLKAYYLNNGLYEELRRALTLRGTLNPAVRSLRNPAHQAVEFYAGKVWPGTIDMENGDESALQIATDNEAIIDYILQVWAASNWNSKKQLAARWCALYGDVFIKVRQSDSGRTVFFQLIEPRFITEFAEDERDNVTMIRIDTPIDKPMGGGARIRTTHIEVWSEKTQEVLIWHDAGPTPGLLADLGAPDEMYAFAAFGIDFVPFVHAKAQDIGEQRGIGCFVHVLDKIDELNGIATRLHQILYRHNKPLWALMANGVGVDGRPLPAPVIGKNASNPNDTTSTVALSDDDVVTLPGTQTLNALVPNLDYASALAAIESMAKEIERDLPEVRYSNLLDLGTQISGRAIRYGMQPAGDKALETRGNLEQAVIRADQMALTIGIAAGIFPATLGTFDAGNFGHHFVRRDVFRLDEMEQAQAELTAAQAEAALVALGMSNEEALRRSGFTDEEIAQFAQERAATTEAQAAALMLERHRAALAFDRGEIDMSGIAAGEGGQTQGTSVLGREVT